jgi:hypothetical protein
MTEVYKIRSKKTGLYSLGGATPQWSKHGKTWMGLGPLKNHLNVLKEYYTGVGTSIYQREEAELVKIEMMQTEVSSIPVLDFIKILESLQEKKKLISK